MTSSAQVWLERVRALQSIAQEGLTYTRDPFDRNRFERLRDLAADVAADVVDGPPDAVRAAVLADEGYLTPKLDVRAAVPDADGRLLLVRESSDGRWSLPGGWADPGQSLAEGAVREVHEETGYDVVVDRLLGVYDRERWGHPPMLHHTLKAVVACRLAGGTPTPSAETPELGWFARDEIPPLSASRTSSVLVRRVFEHLDDLDLGVDL